ncbi:chemotaxis protein CheA [Pusillimonas sp. ANT_WB101]|uniref:chemotaxis protein CheA n=1 Tax=Pusillimonas sp. ANT_WB101 TaxID=2597356 RepID=UPI0011EE411E|nr:chemotaxis protein CheA [Pusillimonas sp. ANT_WB101]KAA0910739.1 chemotaxis protein CheA [Pusillimonas sp. ANT_WB101]
MSAGVDLSQFFETFFDEAEELLADMEQQLLGIDISEPDTDQLDAIFRAAHSIKGGAGTFGCFAALADTTHLLENLLDLVRCGEMVLRKEMIDLFLETKDVLTDQVLAYRNGQEPDAVTYERICAQLRELAVTSSPDCRHTIQQSPSNSRNAQTVSPLGVGTQQKPGEHAPTPSMLQVSLTGVAAKDAAALAHEMSLMGDVVRLDEGDGSLAIWLRTTASVDDIEAVCCFVVNRDQVSVTKAVAELAEQNTAKGVADIQQINPPSPETLVALEHDTLTGGAGGISTSGTPAESATGKVVQARSNSATLRVGVEKVDQIINLVGELVITQAMLVQTAATLDPVEHDRLLNGLEHLERNARDLQEAVMSIRMMPMDYVFSRFPRLVRESATKLGKRITLTTHGQATELDKSLIERIIDPLTHLVRNSIDHGIENPEQRVAVGKNPEGSLVLAAEHHGGQIIIEVSDDGAGLSRERILRKAISLGLPVTENTPDDELWQLIFTPGFSTAEKVTDISGRGVGMDVVKRNIQGMGGHIQLSSRAGQGTTTRIVLPLTLAILDGMSVGVGDETFILPLSHVTESIQPSADQVHAISDTERVLHVRGEYLPLIALHQVFAVSQAEVDVTQSIAVILQAEDTRFALQVDQLLGQYQVVVKNLEANYRKIPGISAATILGDGSVALIVDVFALMRFSRGQVGR